jgi:hypothetical protein
MKLHGVIDLHIRGEEIRRNPNLWDKLKQAFGGQPDLSTGTMRAAIEATTLVEGVRTALRRLGVNNAVSLVIDDQVLFEDREGRADDLGDLFLAFDDAAAVYGQGFRTLRLAAEHSEAGLHIVLEVIALTEHPAESAAARIVLSGRITEYEPQVDEDEETYRRRLEPLVADATALETHRRHFESFVARTAEAVRATLPEVRVEIREAEARVQRPSRSRRRKEPVELSPLDRRYDPFDRYYPNPFDQMLSFMMWSSLFNLAMTPHMPQIMVVDHYGHDLGRVADMPTEVGWGDADVHHPSGNEFGGDMDSDGGGFGDLGGDAGGDFLGGFDGGFDGGGFGSDW